MPRTRGSSADRTITFRVTQDEYDRLNRLLQRREGAVRELTGRAAVSGLVRLLVREACEPAAPDDGLYVSRRRPADGVYIDLSGVTAEVSVRRLLDALDLMAERAATGTLEPGDADEVLREVFGDFSEPNPFSDR